MLWVPLQLATAYACAYPFGRKDLTGDLPEDTAFLVAVDTVAANEIETRRAACTYAAANRFGVDAKCAYNQELQALWVGFSERCAACDSTAVADDDGESYFPAQCTNDADPGADAYAIDYTPAVTNRTRLAIRLDMPVMAETADFLDVLCRDQCSLHQACTDYLALNTRTCLLLGDLTPGHMEPKTTTTTTTVTSTPGTTTATTTAFYDICNEDCDNDPAVERDRSCRYVHNNDLYCYYGEYEYDCSLIDNVDVYHCRKRIIASNVYQIAATLVTAEPVATTTTEPFLQTFDAVSVAAGTAVQHREINRRSTAYSKPFLRWAAMTTAQFRDLPALAVEGELTVLACATACESEPACASAVWGGTNEGCRYWTPPAGPQDPDAPAPIPFETLYWGPGAESAIPVVFSEQQIDPTAAQRFWYDPFVDEQGCTAAGCPSLCQNTAHTHIRVVTLPNGAADAVYTVNIQNCAHLQELHFVPAARLTSQSLTNCTALRKVVFFDTVEPGDGPPPLTSCAVAPTFVPETTIVGCPAGITVSEINSMCTRTEWPSTTIDQNFLCSAATNEFRCCLTNEAFSTPTVVCYENLDNMGTAYNCNNNEGELVVTSAGGITYWSMRCPAPPATTGPVTTIKPRLGGTFTAFPTAQQWNTVAPDTGPDTADLSGNLIRRVRDNALDDYPFADLKNIDASHNLISTVGERAFSGVAASLETVDLSHNWITFLADTAFQECTRLTSLNLNTNRITTLTHALLGLAGNALTALDIRNNYATGVRARTGDGAPGFLEFDVDKICDGFNNACNECTNEDHFVCGDDLGALYPAAIPERFLGLEADTAQIPAPDTGSSTTVWCIPCDGDGLAALNTAGRTNLGETITGVTRLFWTECPHITRATTAAVGYDLATDANGAERMAQYVPAAPQLTVFSTTRSLQDRTFVLGYSAGSVFAGDAGSTTTVLLTRCDTRVLAVLGDQPSRTTAFLGCRSRELYVEPPATAVGAFTFARMANLRRVSLPQTLVSIDPNAFAGSDRIIDLLVPARTTADINPALGAALEPAGCTTPGQTKTDEVGTHYTALATTGAPCSDGFTLSLVAPGAMTRCIHWGTFAADDDASFCDMAAGDYVCCREAGCNTAPDIAECPETVGQTAVDANSNVLKRCSPTTLPTTPAEPQCAGPLCGGTRDNTATYGICGCRRDAPGCFPSPGQHTPLQVANATSPACGPEPVTAMGPLYAAPRHPLFYFPGMTPVEVTAQGATTSTTMLAPIGRLHELCTGAGARGLALMPPPPPPPAAPVRIDNAPGDPQLPLEMSRAANTPDGLPAFAAALVAIGSVGIVLGAARLLRLL